MMRAFLLIAAFAVVAALGFVGGWFYEHHHSDRKLPKQALRVIDGDTIELGTQALRILNLDAPETRRPRAKCDSEIALGKQATQELERVIASGEIGIFPNGELDDSRGKRPRVIVRVNGADVAEGLIAKGLARPWKGQTSDWCESN